MSNTRFAQIPKVDIQRSVFNRDHSYKTTFNEGLLIPVFLEEVLPGDSFKVDANLFARLTSPLKTPVMDNLYLDVQYFFVPNRLVWEHWVNLMGEQVNPDDSTDYLVPTINSGENGFSRHSVADYFGIPTGVPNLAVNALPFRAYNLIYNEWYRDQNLIDSVPNFIGDGGEADTVAIDVKSLVDGSVETANVNESLYWLGSIDNVFYWQNLLRRAKRHDYFTSALPWPQKGPGVELPLGNLAPLALYDTVGTIASPDNIGEKRLDFVQNTNSVDYVFGATGWNNGDERAKNVLMGGSDSNLFVPWGAGATSVLAADLSQATAATINTLRQAFQLQRLYERDARGGTRYISVILSHFSVQSPDARLQRPEYLGGHSQPILINPVTQTSSTDATTPQGNLTAFGVSGGSNKGFRKSFTEHGFIIGLASVRADVTYQQGLNRIFSRATRFDYYWPVLAHLGEQAVYNKEIYAQGSAVVNDAGTPVDDDVFGYQERYAEYRYKPNQITGKLRSTDAQSLDVWHLGQDFAELPKLNKDFIEENAPIERVVAVVDEPHFLLDCWFKVRAARPMPVYGVPGMIDHF